MSLLSLHRKIEAEPPELPGPAASLDRTEPHAEPHIAALLAQTDRLLAVPGVTFSPGFDAVRNGIRALTVLETTIATDTLPVVVAATRREDDALPDAYPSVLAALSDVRNSAAATVQHVLLDGLHAEAAQTADRNYDAVAAAFDELVTSLSDAMKCVDLRPAADPPDWSAEERAARRTAEQTAHRLDEHAALLVLAARLAGKELGHESHVPGAETDQWLQLTVDTRGWHRRLVWDAWDAPIENVAGVWGWLLLAGFDLRATPLADVRPYARASATEGAQQDGAGARRPISWRRATVLLGSGCLALGVALGCSVFAAGFFVAALIEPRDILAAARSALTGTMLLGAGIASGLTWSTFAAVAYDLGAVELVPERRREAQGETTAPRTPRFVEALSRLVARGRDLSENESGRAGGHAGWRSHPANR